MPINSFLYPGAKVTTGYDVDNSLRFNSGSDDNLSINSGTSSNRRTFTLSTWVKTSAVESDRQELLGAGGSSDQNHILIEQQGGLSIWHYNGTSFTTKITTSALLRDPSAWMHLVCAVDTTQGTESNRIKLYINGVQQTSLSETNYPDQNFDFDFMQNGTTTYIGRRAHSAGYKLNSYLAETVFIDGQQLAADQFGEFDEDSGIWKPIDVSGLTFGNAGFYLDFEDSGALGDDVSGNGNDFTVNNLTAIDQSTDTCTNNFATLNPLDQTIVGGSSATMTDGNLTWQSSSNNTSQNSMRGTFGLTQGKWYWEVKYITQSSGNNDFSIGICGSEANLNVGGSGDILEGANPNVMWLNRASNSSVRKNSSDVTTGLTDANIGDIIMLAVDMDNLKFFVGINGTWLNSANPVTGANAPSTIDANTYLPAVSNFGYSHARTLSFNFGSPSFSISSGNTDGNGYGNFEYAVPSSYYSLNTKNLAEYG